MITHESHTNDQEQVSKGTLALRIAFAIFMVFVYVGMGVLLMTNFFGWTESVTWLRWFIGIILVIYGVFRGYRLYKGIN